jgi:hypothetical protein
MKSWHWNSGASPAPFYTFVVRNYIYEKGSSAANKWHCRRKPIILTVLNRVVISIACVYDNLSKALISEFGLHIVAWVSFSAPNPYPNLFDPRLLQIHIQICWIVL